MSQGSTDSACCSRYISCEGLKVKFHRNLNTSKIHRNTYSYQVTPISDKYFSVFVRTDRHTQTDAAVNNTCFANMAGAHIAYSADNQNATNVASMCSN